MIEIEEETIEAKTTTAQISSTYCEGYFAFAKGECTNNKWQSIAAWPSVSYLGTFEQFKESVRQQVLRWSGETPDGAISVKFSKVKLSD